MIHHIVSALRRTGRIAIERPRATLWALLALTAALFAAGLAWIAADTAGRWTATPAGRASMVVYLGEGVDDARARSLAAELGALPGVEHVELVTPEDTARRLQQALGADPALLEGVDLAGLPGSVEVTLAPGVRDVIAMSPTVRALRGAPGVDDVVVEDGGTDKLAGTMSTVRTACRIGAIVLAILALVIVLAAVRVRMERSGHELRVVQLLGGGSRFLVIPTALAGALHGLAAAALAALALVTGLALYGDAIASALGGALAPLHVTMFIASGAALGLVGGSLAGAARAHD